MSDDVRKMADEMEDTATYQPIIDGVKSIANHVERSEKRLDSKILDLEKEVGEKLGKVDEKVEEGFAEMARRLERFGKGHGHVYDTTEPLLAALPESKRKQVGRFESVAKAFGSESLIKDAPTACAVSTWFEVSSKAQLGQYRSQGTMLSKQLDTLNRGFNELGAHVKAASALQEDTPTEGGNLVPTIVEAEIQRLILDAGRVFPRCRQVPMRTKTHKVPAESAAVAVTWTEEEAALTEGSPTFSQLTLQAEKLAALSTMSIELLEDSSVGLLPWLLSVYTEKMARELDLQVVGGDGSGPVITGIINGASVNTVTASATASVGGALDYVDIVQCYMGAAEANTRDGGVWICSPKGYQKILDMVDSNNRPLVSFTGAEVRGPAAMTLLGKPIIETNSVGGSSGLSLDDTTNSATTIVFGPLRSYLFGTRTGMRWDVTDQVGWSNYRVSARLVGRFAGVPGVSAAFTKLTLISYA